MVVDTDTGNLDLVTAYRALIVTALRAAGGNIRAAAVLIGIGRNTLYRKIAAFEIQPAEYGYQCKWCGLPEYHRSRTNCIKSLRSGLGD